MILVVEQKYMKLPQPIALTCFTLLALSGNRLCAIAHGNPKIIVGVGILPAPNI
jgi:hypothetical protein